MMQDTDETYWVK